MLGNRSQDCLVLKQLLREGCFLRGTQQGLKDAIHWLKTGDGFDLGMIFFFKSSLRKCILSYSDS